MVNQLVERGNVPLDREGYICSSPIRDTSPDSGHMTTYLGRETTRSVEAGDKFVVANLNFPQTSVLQLLSSDCNYAWNLDYPQSVPERNQLGSAHDRAQLRSESR